MNGERRYRDKIIKSGAILLVVAYFGFSFDNIECSWSYRFETATDFQELYIENTKARGEETPPMVYGLREEAWKIGGGDYFERYFSDYRTGLISPGRVDHNILNVGDFLIAGSGKVEVNQSFFKEIGTLNFRTCRNSYGDLYSNEFVTAAHMIGMFSSLEAKMDFQNRTKEKIADAIQLAVYQRIE